MPDTAAPPTFDERLDRIRAELKAHIADPEVRGRIMFAVIDYGTAKAFAAIDSMAEKWARSNERRHAGAA